MGAILYDIRHSLRSLKKKPAFYATVLLVFALGIVAGLLPAIQAMRLQIVDALRRV